MVDEPDVDADQLSSVRLEMNKFTRTSQFQSFVISFLVGLRADEEELKVMREAFRALDKDKNGFLDQHELHQVIERDSNEEFGVSFVREDNWWE